MNLKANPSPHNRMRIRTSSAFLVCLLALLLTAPATADRVRTADPDNYRQVLKRLKAGQGWDDGRNHVALLPESEAAFVAPLAGLDGLDLRPLDGRLEMPQGLQLEIRWPGEGQWPVRGRPAGADVFGALAP